METGSSMEDGEAGCDWARCSNRCSWSIKTKSNGVSICDWTVFGINRSS